MLDPQHIDFVRRLLLVLGAAGVICFVTVFLSIWFHDRARYRR